MQTTMLAIKDINPAKYNPREISPYQFTGLCESIKKFGLTQPLIVNKLTNTLVSGHQRLRAAEHLGLTHVPVTYVELSEAEEKALNITMNNKNISGEFTEGLKDILAEIKKDLGDDYLFDLNMDELLKDLPAIEEESYNPAFDDEDNEDDEEETLNNENKPNLSGRCFRFKDSYIICGDSSDAKVTSFIKEITCKSKTLVFTDPPYELESKKVKEIMDNYSKHCVVICTFKQAAELYQAAEYFHFDFVLNAHLPKSFMNKKQPYYTHQNGIYISSVKDTLFDCDNTKGIRSENGYWATIIDAPRNTQAGHGHSKNIKGMTDVLSGFTCDTVIDPFAGSGSMCLAAINLNKNFIGIERESRFVHLILDKIREKFPEEVIEEIEL